MMFKHEFLNAKGISNTSPQTLMYANINVMQGEIVGLLGLNNAGKTDLMRIISGFSHYKSGTIYINDYPVDMHSPFEANNHGVFYIHSEQALFKNSSVAENIFILQPRHEKGLVNNKKTVSKCLELLNKIGLNNGKLFLTPNDLIKNLNPLQVLLVLIAKAVNMNAKLIIIDHLLYEMPNYQVLLIKEILTHLSTYMNISFILVDCRASSLSSLCSRVFILREGFSAGCYDTSIFDEKFLTSVMIGYQRDTKMKKKVAVKDGKKLLEFRNVCLSDSVSSISFEIFSGENIGLCCLSNTLEQIFAKLLSGQLDIKSGDILFEQKHIRLKKPSDAIKIGIGIFTNDCHYFGNFNTFENISLIAQKKFSNRFGIINRPATSYAVSEALSSFICMHRHSSNYIDKTTEKQFIISRNFAIFPKMMIYINLSRELDIISYNEIIKQIFLSPNKPESSLFISSNIHNLISACDRIYFIHDGQTIRELSLSQASYDDIISYYNTFCAL